MHDRASRVRIGSENVPTPLRYRAFLSYSHADTKWAVWLMRRLEGYRVSPRFHGRTAPIGEVGARLAPVFRDRDELPTSSDLGEVVRAALRESATLVVVCSPAAAKSRWVNDEVIAFKRLHGERRVFAFIIAGEPKAEGTADDCFPPALRREIGPDGELTGVPAEVVAADSRPHADGKVDAFTRLIAGLLGVGFDDLRQRDLHRRHQRMTWIAVGSVAGMAITIGLAAIAIIARRDAERRQERGEDLLAFMLGDMKTRLQKADKLEALEEVGSKAMAYFASLNPRDLTDSTLSRQASALTQIGELRMAQLRYGEAMEAFTAAYDRASALVLRHPTDGAILFARGQSEYWIGAVHRKRGELEEMGVSMARYRDTCSTLVRLDPKRADWQSELAYGIHNIAVFDLDRGHSNAARDGLLEEMAILRKLSAADKNDLELRYRMVDARSWLGTVEDRIGNLRAAVASYGFQVDEMEDILRADPGNAKSRFRMADALGLHASSLAITGDRKASLARRIQASQLLGALVASDEKNRGWQKSLCSSQLKQARLLYVDGRLGDAERLLNDSLDRLEKLAVLEPSDSLAKGNLILGLRLRAEILETVHDSGAFSVAMRAVETGERIVGTGKAVPEILVEVARAHLLVGWLLAGRGDNSGARLEWSRALELVESSAMHSRHWQFLDATARALIFLGNNKRGDEIVKLLDDFGYRPLEAWP